MYTLHAIPMTCSLAVHLVLDELALPYEITWASRGPGQRAVGAALEAANPKRKVPTLILPDGEILTEMAAILFLLDETHGPERAPAERRRLLEWLVFLGTELHKGALAPTFDPQTPAPTVDDIRTRLLPHTLEICSKALSERPTLLGGAPGVADAYLWWALLLTGHRWPEALPPTLRDYRRRLGAHGRWSGVLAEERGRL